MSATTFTILLVAVCIVGAMACLRIVWREEQERDDD